jgi:hypothetical protein
MSRIQSALLAVCIALFACPFAQSQNALDILGIPHPARKQLGGPDPMAARERVRAYLRQHGLQSRADGLRSIFAARRNALAASGRYIVRFRPGVSRAAYDNVSAIRHAHVISVIPQLAVEAVRIDKREDVEALRRDPRVLYVESDSPRHPLVADPNDTYYNLLDSNLPSDPSNATWYKWDAHLIQCVDGWSIWPGKYFVSGGKGTAAVKIAVIDTGVDETHPDFINAGGLSNDVASGGQLYKAFNKTIFNGLVTNGAPVSPPPQRITARASLATDTTRTSSQSELPTTRVTDMRATLRPRSFMRPTPEPSSAISPLEIAAPPAIHRPSKTPSTTPGTRECW